MANRRISSLSSLGGTPNTADIIPITDVSDTTGSAQGTTKKVTVANLVAAAPQGDLLASNNLSDVANAGTSRTNLGLGTAATSASTDFSSAFFNIVTKTADYTLTNAENGKVIFCNSSSRIDITVPSGLTSGFNCRVIQGGAGRVRFVASSTTINGYTSGSDVPNAVIGQYGVADLVPTGTNIYNLHGDINYLSLYSNSLSGSFDGTDDYLTTNQSSLAPSGDCTISLWFNSASLPGSGAFDYMFSLTDIRSTGQDRAIGIKGTGSDAQIVANTYGSGFSSPFTNTSISASTWYHVAVVFTSGSAQVYFNGADKGSTSVSTNTGSYTQTVIGGMLYSSANQFNGKIDEVSVFHSALSSTNITSIYNSGVPADISSLSPKGWWRNGDGTGDTDSGGGTPGNTDTIGTVANQGSVNTGSGEGNMTGTNGPTYSNSVPS